MLSGEAQPTSVRTKNPHVGDGWSGMWGSSPNSGTWNRVKPRALGGETLSLELAPGFALWRTGENPHRPQRGQGLLVEIHANVFVIRPSTPIIHIFFSFLCCVFLWWPEARENTLSHQLQQPILPLQAEWGPWAPCRL